MNFSRLASVVLLCVASCSQTHNPKERDDESGEAGKPEAPGIVALSSEEEEDLLVKVSQGDKAAFNALILHNLGINDFKKTEELSVSYYEFDSDESIEVLCELKYVFLHELSQEAAALIDKGARCNEMYRRGLSTRLSD